MSRTWRKKRIPFDGIIEAPDGPWWKQPNGPEEIARRRARMERHQARVEKRRRLLIEQGNLAAQSVPHTRVRRGHVVEIPPEWHGQVAYRARGRARRNAARNKRYRMRVVLKRAARQAFADVE